MKPGDLVKYINLTPYGDPEYLGLILEHHKTWVKIFWLSNVHQKIQDFNITEPEHWKVISEAR